MENDYAGSRMEGVSHPPKVKPVEKGNPSWNGYHVPHAYGDHIIRLMVRDPWTIYSYWEVRKEVEDGVRKEIAEKGLVADRNILRVYSVPRGGTIQDITPVFDLEIKEWVSSWYIHAGEPGREWVVEIGILCTNGEFFCLARSNAVQTPASGMSDVCDEEWMCPEELYYKMFEASGVSAGGKSSLDVREIMERRLREWLSSGSISSGMFGSTNLFTKKS
jgi:uncharacterized protein